ncbi:MAG: hypothetical protein Phyf2KO_24440 [Phycisphaerales bacterium]
MIKHDLQIVTRYRLIAAAVLRLIGLWVLITRPIPLIQQAAILWWQTARASTANVRSGLIYDQPWLVGNLFQAIFFVAAGVVLLVYARRVAIWVVPVPKPRCPGCQYDLKASAAAICPECGLDLSSLQSPAADSQ